MWHWTNTKTLFLVYCAFSGAPQTVTEWNTKSSDKRRLERKESNKKMCALKESKY